MAGAKKKATKPITRNATHDGHSYLTKRIVVARAKAAGKRASLNAMKVMGYIVVAESGSIIKKYEDGRIEEIAKI